MMKSAIEQFKEEMAIRYGVDVRMDIWVHDATTEQALQISKDYELTSELTEMENAFGVPVSYYTASGELDTGIRMSVFYDRKELK